MFCRVVDNFGDAGFAWRLCADLASRGEAVRLWIDDASALAWMAPRGAGGVEIVQGEPPDLAPADIAVETFGCGLPPRYLERMAASAVPPAWIDVEYLSAEAYVERSHGLPSPQPVGGRWLTKRFFFPGFTPRTGGLLREPGLLEARRDFDRGAWLAAHGVEARPDERLVSLFCYDTADAAALLDRLADAPTLVLAAPGAATAQVEAALGPTLCRGDRLRARPLPWLPQPDYDRLLWSCDLNFVRGEDSFVRAQWAGAPFVWQAYAQDDAAHAAKLAAFLARVLDGAEPGLSSAVRAFWAGWNGQAPALPPLPPAEPWAALARGWRDRLAARSDLTTQLLDFAEAAAAMP